MPNKDPIKLNLSEEAVVTSNDTALNAGIIITANSTELDTQEPADINPYIALFDEEPIDIEDQQAPKLVHRALLTKSASQPSITELRKLNNKSRHDKARLLSRINIELTPRDVSLYRAQHRG